jgi:solute carrier family 10 (sodium/bile acid cotransporter), member 7
LTNSYLSGVGPQGDHAVDRTNRGLRRNRDSYAQWHPIRCDPRNARRRLASGMAAMRHSSQLEQDYNDVTTAAVSSPSDVPIDARFPGVRGRQPDQNLMSSLTVICGWLRSEWFVLALGLVVMTASTLPCSGAGADVFNRLAVFAISSLFFLQGARLSRDSILDGMTHWRLHLAIACTTFILFPALGLVVIALFQRVLSEPLRIGILFVCALPSTVQSSIALTSIARGNIPGAICSATASNLIGIVLTPLLLAAVVDVHNGGVDFAGIWKIFVELLVPFITGHLLRPWIGSWADRNRGVLAITDRGSILLVVYSAFSVAVIHGIWHQLPPVTLGILVLIDSMLLAAVLVLTTIGSRAWSMSRADEIAGVFCGSQKSLVTGVPMANALLAGSALGLVLLPIMIYHTLQLFVCACLARRYAHSADPRGGIEEKKQSDPSPGRSLRGSATRFRDVVRRSPLPPKRAGHSVKAK